MVIAALPYYPPNVAATSTNFDTWLGKDGRIAKRLGDAFEVRPEQIEMAKAVEGAFQSGQHLLVEAGTGVGKSFAYLLPSIAAATGENAKRVVVSTHTISLQEQIVDKDIPLLQAIYDDEFTAVLVKGRGNYLCNRRLDMAARKQGSLFSNEYEKRSLHAIEDWASKTDDGSLSTLPDVPDMRVWDRVKAEAGNCLGKRCKFFQGCYWQAARRRMNTGNLLVVNHALFFSDLALRLAGVQYLPKYDHVVFDEAHTIEDVAAGHFGIRVSESAVLYALKHLFDPKRTKGFITGLPEVGVSREKVNDVIDLVVRGGDIAEGFFERCLSWRDRFAKGNGRIREKDIVEDDLSPVLHALAKGLRACAADLAKMDDSPASDPESTLLAAKMETTSQADKIAALAASCEAVIGQTMPDAVYWIEASGRSPRKCTLHAAPVDIAEGLRMALFSKTPGCVLTSATLSTDGGSFEYAQQRLGLVGDVLTEQGNVNLEPSTLQLGSPFNYREQATLHIEAGLPEPSDGRFMDQACDRILHWVNRTQGGCFVLFTSYAMLIQAANRLQRDLESAGYPLLVQGQQAPRKVLLDRFRSSPDSVLFGTSSFWQGVDVRGDNLRNVIIVKLPFAVPDEPVVQARLEQIESRGGNPFMEYSVPEAVIKLKQGFGRLIRSKSDKGIVVLLDGRVLTRRYGEKFLSALPDVKIERHDHRRE